MSTTNVCWYWCFEQDAKKDAPCYEQNNCRAFLFYICATLCTIIGFFGLVILLAILCGFLSDQIWNQTNCHIANEIFPFWNCAYTGFDIIGWYIVNLFYTVVCIWPLGILVYILVIRITTRYRAILLSLSVISGLVFTVFFNMLLAWLWIIISHKKVYNDKHGCVVGDIIKSLNMSCSNDGMIPLGLSIFLFNLVMTGIIIGIAKLIECYNTIKKNMNSEQQKLLYPTP
jgi:hypothetical protein